jgi:hypothetical protein
VIRPYTPVTNDKSDKGYFDFVIKVRELALVCFPLHRQGAPVQSGLTDAVPFVSPSSSRITPLA